MMPGATRPGRCDGGTPIGPENRRFSGGRSGHNVRRIMVLRILLGSANGPAAAVLRWDAAAGDGCDCGCDLSRWVESRPSVAQYHGRRSEHLDTYSPDNCPWRTMRSQRQRGHGPTRGHPPGRSCRRPARGPTTSPCGRGDRDGNAAYLALSHDDGAGPTIERDPDRPPPRAVAPVPRGGSRRSSPR